MSSTTQIQIRNDLTELERLNQLVEEFGAEEKFKAEEEYAIYLCLEELVTNIISYGWPDDNDEHMIDVRLTSDDEMIKVEIQDSAMPFDPTVYGTPDTTLPAEQRKIGGLGIHLVKQTMDSVWYQRLDDRNILILKKKRMAG